MDKGESGEHCMYSRSGKLEVNTWPGESDGWGHEQRSVQRAGGRESGQRKGLWIRF